jgi:hypothetical protein
MMMQGSMQILQTIYCKPIGVYPAFSSLPTGIPKLGTIANTDIRLSEQLRISRLKTQAAVHDELGYYTITLNATDTNTVGGVLMVIAGAFLPVYHEYQ